MELKNIHTRKDFIKVNEIFGGTQGGVGSHDGFANNTKLKDTVLGKIINGLFKGISWLWRKSKENFVINRLIAQLVNELMRGIILFCFDNNISLTEGSMSAGEETKTIKSGDEEGWNENGDEEGHENSEPNQSEPKKLTKEELIAKIEEKSKDVTTGYTTLSQIKANINQVSTKLKSNPTKEEKLKLDEQLNTLNAKLKQRTGEYNADVKELNDLKEQLKNMGGTMPEYPSEKNKTDKQQPEKQTLKINFDEIDKACQDKNRFSNFPAVEKRFENVKSLPNDYSGFKDIKSKCYAFLEKYMPEYNTMGDSDKEKIEKVYVQYKLISNLSTDHKFVITDESAQIFEENLVRSAASNLTHSAGTVKIKPDEPRAGKVSLGKSIAMKAGASANVGNILTKRDRDKHKDKAEFFDIDVHDINLAEIEKTVQELEKTINDVRTKVSSYVNPYNVKTIQLSAEQLMAPRKTDDGVENNDDLRLRWNKELTKTFASFTFIMDVDKISSIMKNESSTLNSGKIKDKVDSLTSNIKNQSEDAECSSKLPLLEGYANYSKMSEGGYYYYSFYYKNRLYKTSMAPVKSTFNSFGLVNMTSWINSVNDNNTIVEDTNLNDFKSLNSDSPRTGNIKKLNIYLLFKYKQAFPDSNRQLPAKVFVLNEYIYDNGESYIFLKKNGVSQDVKVTQSVIDNFTKTDYIFDIKTVNFKKFNNDIDNLKPALHIDDSNNFSSTKPKFLTDEVIKYLTSLNEKI